LITRHFSMPRLAKQNDEARDAGKQTTLKAAHVSYAYARANLY
jgi:hypothetical protein